MADTCPGGQEAHYAHMEVNGECPWCLTYDPTQTEFGSVDEKTGTIRDRNGDIIEEGLGG